MQNQVSSTISSNSSQQTPQLNIRSNSMYNLTKGESLGLSSTKQPIIPSNIKFTHEQSHSINFKAKPTILTQGYDQIGKLLSPSSVITTNSMISPSSKNINNTSSQFKNAINPSSNQQIQQQQTQNNNQLNASNGSTGQSSYQYNQTRPRHQSQIFPFSTTQNSHIGDFARLSFAQQNFEKNFNGMKLSSQAKENDFFTNPSFTSSIQPVKQSQAQTASFTSASKQIPPFSAPLVQQFTNYQIPHQQQQTNNQQQSAYKVENTPQKNQILSVNQNLQNQGQTLQQGGLKTQQNTNILPIQTKDSAIQFLTNSDLETELKELAQLLRNEREGGVSMFTNNFLQTDREQQNQEMKLEVELLKEQNDVLQSKVERLARFTVEYDKEQQLVLLQKNLALKKQCDENETLCMKYQQLERTNQMMQEELESQRQIILNYQPKSSSLSDSIDVHEELEKKIIYYEDKMREDDIQSNKLKLVIFKQEESIALLECMVREAKEASSNLQSLLEEQQVIRASKEKEFSELQARFDAQQKVIAVQKEKIDGLKSDLNRQLNEERVNDQAKACLRVIEEEENQKEKGKAQKINKELIEKIQQLEVLVLKLQKDVLQNEKEINQKDSQIQQKQIEIQFKDSEIKSKESEIQQLMTQMKQKDSEIKKYQQDIREIQQEVNQKQQELNQKQQELNQKQQELDQKQQKIEQKKKQINQKKQEISQIQKELNKKQSEILILEQEGLILSRNTNALSDKVVELQATVENNAAEIKSQEIKLQQQSLNSQEALNSQQNSLSQHYQQLLTQLTEKNLLLQEQLVRVNSILDSTSVNFEVSTKENIREKNEAVEHMNKYLDEVCALKTQIKELVKVQEDQRHSLTELACCKDCLNAELDKIRLENIQQSIAFNEREHQLNNQIEQLNNQIEQLNNQIDQLNNQIGQLIEVNKALKQQQTADDKEIQEVKSKIVCEKEQQILQLISENKSMVEEKVKLSDQIRELHQTNIDLLSNSHSQHNANVLQIQSLQHENNQYQSNIFSLKEQVNQFILELKQFQAQLDALKQESRLKTEQIHSQEDLILNQQNQIEDLIEKSYLNQETGRQFNEQRMKELEDENIQNQQKYQHVSQNLNMLEQQLSGKIEELNKKAEEVLALEESNSVIKIERENLLLENNSCYKEISKLSTEMREIEKKVVALQETLNEQNVLIQNQKEDIQRIKQEIEEKERIIQEQREKLRFSSLEMAEQSSILDEMSLEIQKQRDYSQIIQKLKKEKEMAELEQIKLFKDNEILRLHLIQKQPDNCTIEQVLKEHNDVLNQYYEEIQRLKEKLQQKQLIVDKFTNKIQKQSERISGDESQIVKLQQQIEQGRKHYEKRIEEQSDKIDTMERQYTQQQITLNNQIHLLMQDKQQMKLHLESIQKEMQEVTLIQNKLNTFPSNR